MHEVIRIMLWHFTLASASNKAYLLAKKIILFTNMKKIILIALATLLVSCSNFKVDSETETALNQEYGFSDDNKWNFYENDQYGFSFYYPSMAKIAGSEKEMEKTTIIEEGNDTLYITIESRKSDAEESGMAVYFGTARNDSELDLLVKSLGGNGCTIDWDGREEKTSFFIDSPFPPETEADACYFNGKNHISYDSENGTLVIYSTGRGGGKMFDVQKDTEYSSYDELQPFDLKLN